MLRYRLELKENWHERFSAATAALFMRRSFLFPPAPYISAVTVSGIRNRCERLVERDFRRRLVEDDVEVVFPLGPFFPLATDDRSRAYVRHRIGRSALPGDRTNDRLIVSLRDGVADRSGIELLGALESVDRDLEVGMLESERLGPLLSARFLVGVAILLRGLAGQARLEGVMVRPPDFGRHPRAAVAQCLNRGGKQQRLGRCHDLGLETLLRALRPENRELRWIENAAAD